DAHQHLWRYDAVRHDWITDEMITFQPHRLQEGLKEHLDPNGLVGCVAVQALHSTQDIEFRLELRKHYSLIKGVVGLMDIENGNFRDRLDHYAANQALKGLRHLVQDEPDDRFLLRDDVMEGIGMLRDYDLTYDILILEHQLPTV